MLRSRPVGTQRRLGAGVVPLTIAGLLLSVLVAGVAGSGRGADPVVLVGYGRSAGSPPPATASGHPAPPAAGPSAVISFSISGQVKGLFPGSTRSLMLTVANPQRFAITVTSISTTVGAGPGLCGSANVVVTSFSGQLPVAAKAKATTVVQATMAHSAPDACQGAHFPFAYSGSGTES